MVRACQEESGDTKAADGSSGRQACCRQDRGRSGEDGNLSLVPASTEGKTVSKRESFCAFSTASRFALTGRGCKIHEEDAS